MRIAAKVAAEKALHPERFCSVPRCLWRTLTRDGVKPCRKHPAAALHDHRYDHVTCALCGQTSQRIDFLSPLSHALGCAIGSDALPTIERDSSPEHGSAALEFQPESF